MSELPTNTRRDLTEDVSSPSPVASARRLPGKGKAQAEMLRAYEEFNIERRERISAALWPFLAPGPNELYRWRVQLTCGCVHEVLTYGDIVLPTESRWPDPVHHGHLPPGQLWCWHDGAASEQYEVIVEWGARRERTFPADPTEPRYGMDEETWTKIRRDNPHSSAFWTVSLSCGHSAEVCTSCDWQPVDGPKRVTAERQREMIAEFEELSATDSDNGSDREREHMRRELAAGWPRPATEQLCYVCPHARTIVAYQRTDWLVPRAPAAKATQPRLSRKQLEQRLVKAQAEITRLENEVAKSDRYDLEGE